MYDVKRGLEADWKETPETPQPHDCYHTRVGCVSFISRSMETFHPSQPGAHESVHRRSVSHSSIVGLHAGRLKNSTKNFKLLHLFVCMQLICQRSVFETARLQASSLLQNSWAIAPWTLLITFSLPISITEVSNFLPRNRIHSITQNSCIPKKTVHLFHWT
jgi:hypothetical protein